MGTARSRFFITASIIMTVSGGVGIVVLILMLLSELHNEYSHVPIVLICSVLALMCNIMNIITGIRGIKSSCRRSNSAVVIRLPEISVILCLIMMILLFINGVSAWQAFLFIATGIACPCIFIYAAVRKSYI